MNTSQLMLRDLTLLITAAAFCSILLLEPVVNRAQAEVVLPSYLSSNMVLQRGAENRIWGAGTVGARIRVQFLGEHANSKVGANNLWEVKLKVGAVNSKGPSNLTIVETIKGKPDIVTTNELANILVGDVWIIRTTTGEGVTIPSAPLSSLASPVRILHLSNLTNLNELGENINIMWQMPDTSDISALARYFAEELSSKQPNVPIGIVLSDLRDINALKPNQPFDPNITWLNEIKDQALRHAKLKGFDPQKKAEFANLLNLKREGVVSTNSLLINYPKAMVVHMRSDFDSKQLPASLLSFEGALW